MLTTGFALQIQMDRARPSPRPMHPRWYFDLGRRAKAATGSGTIDLSAAPSSDGDDVDEAGERSKVVRVARVEG